MQAAHEDSEDESSSSDEDDDAPPVLHLRALAHAGGVNRLRAMPQQPGIIAAWADTGAVQVCLASGYRVVVRVLHTCARSRTRAALTPARDAATAGPCCCLSMPGRCRRFAGVLGAQGESAQGRPFLPPHAL